MPKAPYLPLSDDQKADFLDNFAAKLPTYATALGVAAGEVTDVQNGALWFRYALTVQTIIKAHAVAVTAAKNAIRDGTGGTPASMPALPTLPAPPAGSVNVGVFRRITALVQRIKNHANYTDPIGQDFGIEGADQVIDPSTWKQPSRS